MAAQTAPFLAIALNPKHITIAEAQFVDSLEEWRHQVGLDRFILLGHSLGGTLLPRICKEVRDLKGLIIMAGLSIRKLKLLLMILIPGGRSNILV